MRRFQIVLVILSVVISGAIIWRALTPSEPVYQGKTVNAWLDTTTNFFAGGSAFVEYRTAFQHMGSQAVPFIFRRVEKNDSPLRNWWRDRWPRLPIFFQKHLPRPRPITFSASMASIALRACGTNAVPLIIKKINAGNPAVRDAAWATLTTFVGKSISTNESILLCLPALKDNDAMVRLHAGMCLGRLGAAASNAVPAIIPLLSSDEAGREPTGRVFVRANTAIALGSIGPVASNALPALTNLMAKGDHFARVCAAFGIWHITSNEIPVLPVIINELPSVDQYSKTMPIKVLKEMGPRAKAAFPMLLKELSITIEVNQRLAIAKALIAIDPEAAAKAGIKKEVDVITAPPTPAP